MSGLPGLIAFGVLVALAVAASARIAARLPLHATATRTVRLAFAAGISPFVLGLAAVVVLAALPRQSHLAHYVAIAALVLGVRILPHRRDIRVPAAPETGSRAELGLLVLLVAFLGILVVHAVAYPLVQSDALEYAMAGRRLYLTRTLAAYPPTDPTDDPSGFYGPWTHPPLYAALTYVAFLCQATGDSPGLMRAVSPWAFAAAAALVYAVGACRSRVHGALAALFLVSVPSLFLGAGAAAIDSLTVLAMALALAGAAFLRLGQRSGCVALGMMIGAGMWSHSQSVLLLPLIGAALLAHPDVGWRRAAAVGIPVLGGVVLLGAWPYVANLWRSGVLISDTPAVYALERLAWDDWFAAERHIGPASARLLYGVLKGWTTLDAFGLSFWFMAVGAGLTLRAMRSAERRAAAPAGERAALAVITCWLAGVTLSTVLGIDVMIRNERYFLIIAPAVALVAAAAVSPWFVGARPRAGGRVARSLVTVGFAAMLVGLAMYRIGGRGAADVLRSADEKLLALPSYQVAWQLDRSPASATLVLTFKPSDLYYARRTMVSYLDPRLLDAYVESDPKRLAAALASLRIGEVHVPPYPTPPLYNSAVGALIADPALASLVTWRAGYQIYELTRGAGGALCGAREVGPQHVAWQWSPVIVASGARDLARWEGSPRPLRDSLPPHGAVSWFQRERRTMLRSAPIAVAPEAEWLVTISLNGQGGVHLAARVAAADGERVEPLGGLVLSGGRAREYARRFRTSAGDRTLRFEVTSPGSASIGVARARLTRVCDASVSQGGRRATGTCVGRTRSSACASG